MTVSSLFTGRELKRTSIPAAVNRLQWPSCQNETGLSRLSAAIGREHLINSCLTKARRHESPACRCPTESEILGVVTELPEAHPKIISQCCQPLPHSSRLASRSGAGAERRHGRPLRRGGRSLSAALPLFGSWLDLRICAPEQSRARRSSLAALLGAGYRILLERRAIGLTDRGLGRNDAGGRATGDSLGANVFSNDRLVIVVRDNLHNHLPDVGKP